MIHDPLLLTRIKGLVRSNRLRLLYVLLADMLGWRHLIVRLDPVMACNLRCAMCYFSDEDWRAGHGGRMTRERLERIADTFFPTALQLYVGCGAEPTMYRDFPDIVRMAKDRGVPFVSLVTNGQLLTRENLARVIGHGLDEIVVSIHGTTRETYEGLMTGVRFDTLLRTLDMIAASRSENGGKPRLRVNYTANPDNLDELAGFFGAFGAFGIDVLQVRPVIDLGATRYRSGGLAPVAERYRAVMAALQAECRSRGVALLANLDDPGYQDENPDAAAYLAVLRVVSPEQVWQPGFDPDTLGYGAFKRAIGYRRGLLRGIVFGVPKSRNQPLASSGLS